MEDINFSIFKQIATDISKEEFTNAQHAYFEKHKEPFEDTEENKLEYT